MSIGRFPRWLNQFVAEHKLGDFDLHVAIHQRLDPTPAGLS
jgi:hypothetical protein